MLAWLQRRKQRRWARDDASRRQHLEQSAFADGRFVLDVIVNGRPTPIRFTPRESEAEQFFTAYLIPWMRGELRWLSHSNWGGPPLALPLTSRSYTEIFRGCDVREMRVMAPNDAYRQRLDDAAAVLLKAAEAKAEANRLAERGSFYSMTIAAMRDSQRAIEEDGR